MNLQAINLVGIRQQKEIFAQISFELTQGDALFIHGDNGAGKSSLLRIIAGLSIPSAGKMLWQGKAISQFATEYWAQLHYVGHANGIKSGLSVEENLQLARHLSYCAFTPLDSLLESLHLTGKKNMLARDLSAGQKRRLALAKLFLFPKSIWILDEPFVSLDEKSQTFFLSQLEQHLKNGGISIISSHQPIHLSTLTNTQNIRLTPC